jgi:hypothetical protein
VAVLLLLLLLLVVVVTLPPRLTAVLGGPGRSSRVNACQALV